MRKLFTKAEAMICLNAPVMQFTVYTCILLISWLGAKMIVAGDLTTGNLAALLAYCMSILMNLMMLSFVFVMKFINAFKSFSAIDVMTQGGPQGSSMVLGYWIYNAGRVKFNYGFAMVGAIILTAMVAVFTLLANKGFRKED